MPLKSSGRTLPKKIHGESSVPGSARKVMPEYKAYESEANPVGGANMMMVGTARVNAGQPPEAATLPMKLPSVASPTVGTHLAQPMSNAAVLSSEKTPAVMFGQNGNDTNQSQLNRTMQSTGRPQ